MSVTAREVRSFVLENLSDRLGAVGLTPEEVPDDFDLLGTGVIDSLGILEIVASLEERFGLQVDFEQLDPERLTVIGPFSEYVEEQSTRSSR